jgi:hypothetical protein
MSRVIADGLSEALASRISSFTPEQFDTSGGTDYAVAIETMLAEANGRLCTLEDGKTYTVSRKVLHQGDVNIRSKGKSEIFIEGQADIIELTGSVHSVTTLSTDIEINAREWAVGSTAGVVPGMLMEVKSSLSWYHDPRPTSTDARKSELHKVVSVDGSTISTELPANDGYDVLNESVEITFISPISVYIEGVTVRGVHETPAETTSRPVGWEIAHALDSVLLHCGSKDFSAAGAVLMLSYNSKIIGGSYDGANNYFTGYGVQTQGTTLCRVEGTRHWECRRGVDVSGGNIISLHTVVEGCVQTGGGYNSRGDVYGWDGAGSVGAPNYGFGTHGPADKTTFINCEVSRCHVPFISRGRATLFQGGRVHGRTRGGVFNLSYGLGCIIKGTCVEPSLFGGKSTQTLGGGNINSRLSDRLLTISDTFSSSQDYPIVIEGNYVNCEGSLIELSANTAIKYSNNQVNFRSQSAAEERFIITNTSATALNLDYCDIDSRGVNKYDSGRWSTFGPGVNLGRSSVVSGEAGKFTAAISTISGDTPTTPNQELSYAFINGVVHITGSVRVDVTAAVGAPITVFIDNLPLPRAFISSLQAQGLAGSLNTTGNVTARALSGDNSRLGMSLRNLGESGSTYINLSATYAIQDAVPA